MSPNGIVEAPIPPVPSEPRPTLLGVPYDGGSSFLRGPAGAPAAIREALASPSTNGFSESLRDLSLGVGLADAGDVDLAAAEPLTAIEEAARLLLRSGATPIFLGGDHSVSHPILRAVGERVPGLTILHVDAHSDLYDEFDGDRYSHACPFARVMEDGIAGRLVQVGIRTLTEHQRTQARRFGVEIVDMRAWQMGARPEVSGPVYVSMDMDALDPAFAPGVSHWEPGGLGVREVLTLIQTMGGRLVGADVVEYNPTRDPSGVTAYVAAKLVKELASRMLDGG